MKVPHTIPKSSCKSYKPAKSCLNRPGELNRILKAELVTWDEFLPKSLSDLAVDALIKSFAEKPVFDDILLEKDKNLLLENLPLDLPLKIAIPMIPDGIYWQRRAVDRWPSPLEGTCNISQHDKSWKVLYLERDIEEWIEKIVPGDEDELGVMGPDGWGAWQKNEWVTESYSVAIEVLSESSDGGTEKKEGKEDMFGPEEDINGGKQIFESGAEYKDQFPDPGEEDEEEDEEEEEEEDDFEEEDSDASPLKKIVDKPENLPRTLEKVSWAANYIHHLRLRQLQVGRPSSPPPEDSLHNCVAEPPPTDHIDLGPILCKIDNLMELSIVYEVRNLGTNFAWNYFTFSLADSVNLARGLLYCKQLKIFRLSRSDLDDQRLIILLKSLVNGVQPLETLDFSHNKIENDGAMALAKLISCHSSLRNLILCNNCIGSVGVQGISFALASSPVLTHLDLRLNSLVGDDGCAFISSALCHNKKMESLTLAACGVGERGGKLLGDMLKANSTILELNLSNNNLGEEAGGALESGLTTNFAVKKLDLRMTNVSQECEYTIRQLLSGNESVSRKTPTKRKQKDDPLISTAESSIMSLPTV